VLGTFPAGVEQLSPQAFQRAAEFVDDFRLHAERFIGHGRSP
jgi:hypothetical protein